MVSPNFFLWPTLLAAEWSRFMGLALPRTSEGMELAGEAPNPTFTSKNEIVLELRSLRVREFIPPGDGVPTLVCAPYALHGATIADFADGHSLMQVLARTSRGGLFLAEWRSATPAMKYLSIDALLADLNVAIDDLGGLVNLVGLCQGGWMSMLYAARFPGKVARVVAAGSPLDVTAEASHLSAHAAATPLTAFQELVQDGDGLVLGRDMLRRWSSTGGGPQAPDILMMPPDVEPEIERATGHRFEEWFSATLDLPGTYYLQVVQWLYQENRLVQDRMPALGKLARLGDVTARVLLLAASDDEIVPPRQIFAAARCLSASPAPAVLISAPGPHLGLFLGQRTMAETWPVIADWLGGDNSAPAKRTEELGSNNPPGRPQRSRTKRPGASPRTG